MDYEQSSLWKTAFSHRQDGLDRQRDLVAQAYRDFRAHVELLLQEIRSELPLLTVHDITHVDALWGIASTIAGSAYPLNPAEALVLGGAFLLHDAAHCRAAYPGGLSELRATTEWRDSVARRGLVERALVDGSTDFQNVLFDTLRVLHPHQASKLPFAKWPSGDGEHLHLFPHNDLRSAYGQLIGEIAESHWAHPHELENWKNKVLGSPACLAPAAWTVNQLKIAVLLRVADAAHIDAKRAPRFLMVMTQPSGISLQHWQFQTKMHQPFVDAARRDLVFTGGAFPYSERNAWWLAYDAACLADKELQAAEHLLRDAQLEPLAVREVAGVRSPAGFATHVKVSDWIPIDTSLRIGNVARLIERFGGRQLYGDKPELALRELLQNARDAVVACRALGALGETEGRIDVELESQNGADWLHVTDTGIGMSAYVLTEVLLDFGRSLWRDGALQGEWPGLAASSFEAVGQFGIGFFSIFMLGESVKVTTRRYEQASSDDSAEWVLEFPKGLAERPVLRSPTASERLPRHGTRVTVRLTEAAKLLSAKRSWFDLASGPGRVTVPLSLSRLVGALAPALDIDLWAKEREQTSSKVLSAGDWRSIDGRQLLNRVAARVCGDQHHEALKKYIDSQAQHISALVDPNGNCLGRAVAATRSSEIFGFGTGVIVVGGLFAAAVSGVDGVLVGEQSDRLDRTVAVPLASADQFRFWADHQAGSLANSNALSQQQSAVLIHFGSRHPQLPLGMQGGKLRTVDELRALLAKSIEIWLIERHDADYDPEVDEVDRTDFEKNILFDTHVLELIESFEAHYWTDEIVGWPLSSSDAQHTSGPPSLFASLIKEIWGDADVEERDEVVVATVGGHTKIERPVKVIRRKQLPIT